MNSNAAVQRGTLALFVILSLAIINLSIASDFSANSFSTAESGSSNQQLNFTISNTDTQLNITQVNITLPLAFSFIPGSNTTSATATSFYNSSDNISWVNTTLSGFVENGTEEYFLFNVSVPSGTGEYNFTVSVLFTDGSSNTTNVTITVSDTTPPALSIYYPQNITYSTTSMWLNFTYTEINPDSCWYDYNGTNTSLASCQNQSFQALDGQTSVLVLYMNDTSGNLGSASVGFTVSTPPTNIIPVSPTPGNNSYINSAWVLVNVTFSETNPDSCVLDWNNQTNYTMTRNGTYCYRNVTGLSDGIYRYSIYVNDTYGNLGWNGTWTVKVERTAPYITINYPQNNSNITTGTLNINFTVTDSVASSMNCSLYMDGNSSYSYNNASVINATPDNYTHAGLTVGIHNITINCSDANYTGTSFASFGVYPDISIQSVTWNSTGSSFNDNRTTQGSNITVAVTIINTGDFNITSNATLLLKWDGYTNRVINGTYEIPAENLTSGSSHTVVFYDVINTTYVTSGYHTITAELSTNESEASLSNNTLTIGKTVGYNITVIDSYGWASWTNSSYPAKVDPGETVLFNVSITYANGDPVTDLNVSLNFTVSETSPNSSRSYTLSSSGNSSGYYWFNITAPSVTSGYIQTGIYNLRLNVTKGNYTGTSGLSFNLTAPRLGSSPSGLFDLDLQGGSSIYEIVNITVSNPGNKDASNVNVNYWASSGVSLSFVSWGHCWNITSLPAGSSNSTACIGIKVTATSTGTKHLYVNVTGRDADNRLYYNYADYTFTVSDSGNQSSSSDQSTQQTSASASTSTPSYSLDITNYQSNFEAVRGETITTSVTVKNTGNSTMTVKLSVNQPSLESITVAPTENSISSGGSATFSVEMKLPSDIELGEYIGTFKAYKSDDESVSKEKAFTISVVESIGNKSSATEKYNNYSALFNELKERLDAINNSGVFNESNLTLANSILNEILTLLSQANSSMSSGDYRTAETILETVRQKLEQASEELERLENEQKLLMSANMSGVWLWAFIIIIVAALSGFLYYTFFMQKGYHPQRGFRPTEPSGIADRVSSVIKTIKYSVGSRAESIKPAKMPTVKKEETSFAPKSVKNPYKEGYVSHAASEYSYKEGLFSRIKNRFRKKDKSQKRIWDY